MIDALSKEKVLAGDVIVIDKTSGKVSKLGRSFARSRDYDAMGADIVQIRCEEEDVTLTSDALNVLTSMASSTTLRYALNLISCAQMISRRRKAEHVDIEDLRRAYTYFMDEKRSVQWLKEQQGSLVFEEIADSTTSASQDAPAGDAMET
ncbi:hypothetical protein ID866_8543 [Astraeus odoratus]|nr:hypothetical protein ID866_8543 [Astraeus odoratus]